jgi:hypothetical protein
MNPEGIKRHKTTCPQDLRMMRKRATSVFLMEKVVAVDRVELSTPRL